MFLLVFYLITRWVAVVGVGVYSCMSRRGEDFISGCDPGGVGCGDLSCDDRLMMISACVFVCGGVVGVV
ncbi:hypothetical protein, partial [Rothia dentocariosa]|uniref:hypothetical protein n=1 Tax=Rothia dentocariosa TaxID=2047 RepID=UPI001C533453